MIMRSILLVLLTLFVLSLHTHSLSKPHLTIDGLLHRLDSLRPAPSLQESAAKGLLQRLIPTHFHSFDFRIISKDVCGGSSCFLIENYDGPRRIGPEIVIKGTTGVEIAAGLHWYLKYKCNAHVSWDKTGGTQIASVPHPGHLPRLDYNRILIRRPVPWNYYQNVVTSSYSYVWWGWERWQKEIDWMALQGINLPLAFTGQEAIWQKVFKRFNISKEDLDDYFGGLAFLAWARMGNLHAWGGPLSENWLHDQLLLQKQIISRMLELGMTPVLPSFSGNVPSALRKIYPGANITQLDNWNTVDGDSRWCCTYLLSPSDPLFIDIGEAFIKQQIEEYGEITNIYNCDTFNENTPPTSEPEYISSLGAAVYKAMSKGNKNAVWLMQGWLFSSDSKFWKPPQMKALLHSVPLGKMIVLDLFADVKPIWNTSSQFYGTPYIWCMLHNFGGNIEMYGTLDSISSGPIDAFLSENSTMVGVGMCMEGIEHNPVVYELMSEMAFRDKKVDVQKWLKSYARRRYMKENHQIEAAWEILYHTVYNCTDGIADHNTDFIVKLPDWYPSSSVQAKSKQTDSYMISTDPYETKRRFLFQENSSDLPKAHLWYSTKEVIKALQLFLEAGDDLLGSLTYRYDMVDLTRQVLSKLANQVYTEAVTAFVKKDIGSLRRSSEEFLELIKDIDVLLASDDNFLLGTWLESAKKLARNGDERKQYEWNARTQVTMWYDSKDVNQSKLHDYVTLKRAPASDDLEVLVIILREGSTDWSSFSRSRIYRSQHRLRNHDFRVFRDSDSPDADQDIPSDPPPHTMLGLGYRAERRAQRAVERAAADRAVDEAAVDLGEVSRPSIPLDPQAAPRTSPPSSTPPASPPRSIVAALPASGGDFSRAVVGLGSSSLVPSSTRVDGTPVVVDCSVGPPVDGEVGDRRGVKRRHPAPNRARPLGGAKRLKHFFQFEYNSDVNIVEDPDATARIAQHFRKSGCKLPSFDTLGKEHMESYLSFSKRLGDLMAEYNRSMDLYERRVRSPTETEFRAAMERIKSLESEVKNLSALREKDADKVKSVDKVILQLNRSEYALREAEISRDDYEVKLSNAIAQNSELFEKDVQLVAEVKSVKIKYNALLEARNRDLTAARVARAELKNEVKVHIDRFRSYLSGVEKLRGSLSRCAETKANSEILEEIINGEIEDLNAELKVVLTDKEVSARELLDVEGALPEIDLSRLEFLTLNSPELVSASGSEAPEPEPMDTSFDEFGSNLGAICLPGACIGNFCIPAPFC